MILFRCMSDCHIKLIKTHPDAIIPTKAHEGDNCFDLYAVEETVIHSCSHITVGNDNRAAIGTAVVPVGLKVGHITPGFGFAIRGRSGLGFKHGIQPHCGEIDNGYRGDLGIKLYNFTDKRYVVEKGERIAQIKIERIWDTEIIETEEQVESDRGESGFGSSGK